MTTVLVKLFLYRLVWYIFAIMIPTCPTLLIVTDQLRSGLRLKSIPILSIGKKFANRKDWICQKSKRIHFYWWDNETCCAPGTVFYVRPIHGWSRSQLTWKPALTGRDKLTSQSPLITVEFFVWYNLKYFMIVVYFSLVAFGLLSW